VYSKNNKQKKTKTFEKAHSMESKSFRVSVSHFNQLRGQLGGLSGWFWVWQSGPFINSLIPQIGGQTKTTYSHILHILHRFKTENGRSTSSAYLLIMIIIKSCGGRLNCVPAINW